MRDPDSLPHYESMRAGKRVRRMRSRRAFRRTPCPDANFQVALDAPPGPQYFTDLFAAAIRPEREWKI